MFFREKSKLKRIEDFPKMEGFPKLLFLTLCVVFVGLSFLFFGGVVVKILSFVIVLGVILTFGLTTFWFLL